VPDIHWDICDIIWILELNLEWIFHVLLNFRELSEFFFMVGIFCIRAIKELYSW
jgi:hypothetical protein